MKITLTQNKFNPNPYYDQRIKAEPTDNFIKNLPRTMDTFDQNGFDLTNLERLYAKKMDYDDIVLVGIYEYDELKLGFQRFLTPSTEGLELGYFKNNVLDGYGFSSTDLTYTKYHFGNFKDGTANGTLSAGMCKCTYATF